MYRKMPSNRTEHEHLKYRSDIDGLRAFAIVSVVLYHAFPSFMRGGFIGVDVFFVISGYLISSIIFKGLITNSFSFFDFYQRRIKRIFPALILVLTVCYVVGWFTLMADEFSQLGKHFVGSIGFAQNIVLYRESGYFDTASELKPLLHLWSLGVEEQFYVLFPVVVWGLWRWRVAVLPIIIVMAVLSLGAGAHKLATNPSAAFFMPQYRFWEILVGSVAAYYAIFSEDPLAKVRAAASIRNCISALGAAALIVSVVVIDQHKAFPGFWALLPVSGSVLMILAGSDAWVNRRLMSNKGMVWIGLISYPLYLWHWVVITYIRIIDADELSFLRGMFAVSISLFLAFLTYKFVEIPFRKKIIRAPKAAILLALGFIVAMAGVITYSKSGISERLGMTSDLKSRESYVQNFDDSLPERAYSTKHRLIEVNRSECGFFDFISYIAGHPTMEPRSHIDTKCFVPKANTKIVMLWGDSHARHLYYGLSKTLPSSASILQITSSGCEPNLPGASVGGHKYCEQSNKFAFEVMKKEKPDVLVMGQSENHDEDNSLTDLAAQAKLLGVKAVIVVGPVPHFDPFLYKIVARKYWNNTPKRINTNLMQSSLDTDNALKVKYASGAGGFAYLSAMRFFCNDDGCMTYLGPDRKTGLVTYDYGHLTLPASAFFAEKALAPLIMKNLNVK